MRMNAYSLFDRKASAFAQPFFFHHDGQAIRAVMDLLQDQNTIPARHPADFELYKLGSWEDGSGRFENEAIPLGPLTSFLPTRQAPLPMMQGD